MSRFLGGFTHKVDRKGRFSIPAQILDGIAQSAEGTFVVVPGIDDCLDMYPLDEWTKRANFLQRIPLTMGRVYKRKVLSKAIFCKVDPQRRVLIPPEVLRSVGIEKEVFILGQLDHIELWNPDAFERFLNQHDIPLANIYKEIEDYIFKSEHRSDPEGRS